MKVKYLVKLFLGIFIALVGVIGIFVVFRDEQKLLLWVFFAVMIIGGFMMRHAILDLMRMAGFNRKKQEALNQLEALYNQGDISTEEYYAQKIQLLGMEYGS